MKTFIVRIAILLEPVGTPDVVIRCGSKKVEIKLSTSKWFYFEYTKEEGPDQLTVEHRNRLPSDGVTAVVVKAITLNDITHMQNTYQGIFYPVDKEPKRTDYVDFNGIWILEFTIPVFTWMHQTQGLGWIYD